MKRSLPVLTLVILLMPAISLHATNQVIPVLPEWPQSAWDIGSSVTHRITMSQNAENLVSNLRLAVLGTETEGDTTLYWVEFDLTGISGLQPEDQMFFINNYGELPNAIRMNVLMPRYDFSVLHTDPAQFYYDVTQQGFIRALIFQYNRQVPYDVDPALIGGFLLPIVASSLMGNDLPEDFVTERNLGIVSIEDPEAYTTELSGSRMTLDAGRFDGSLFTFTSNTESGPSGTLFYSDEIPVVPFVIYTTNWLPIRGQAETSFELIAFENSGAITQIVGEPVRFDIMSLMSYGM